MLANVRRTTFAVLIASATAWLSPAEEVAVHEADGVVAIENGAVRIEFDLRTGRYRAVDTRDGTVCLSDVFFQLDDWPSTAAGARHAWTSAAVTDRLGKGRALVATTSAPARPDLVLELTLYEDRGCIALAAGLENTTDDVVRLKRILPVAGGVAFDGLDIAERFSMLDGHGGGQATAVIHGGRLSSRNNLLVAFGPPGANRSLVLGGLTYHDFEKFARVGASRRAELAARDPGLVAYLDLGVQDKDGGDGAPLLRLVQGKGYTFPDVAGVEFATIVFDNEAVAVEVAGLDPQHDYHLGFSWWDERSGRCQTVAVDSGPDTTRHTLLDKQALPCADKKQGPEERVVSLPREAYGGGSLRVVFANEGGVNAVVSEVWLAEGPAPADAGPRPVPMTPGDTPPERLEIQLYAEDPVGKRIDPGTRYLPDDRFYVDFTTDNPFEALEGYGRCVRAAQGIDLNVYDFPTVCLWYAEIGGYGNGPAVNDTPGAVDEMDRIVRSGFLNYSRAAVRLVPDLYDPINQQGWWDDAHWRRGGGPAHATQNGRHIEPYETTAKWAGAVLERGGIPLTYFQTGRVSKDYVEQFPEHMLFNDSSTSYDYTDPEFLRHMREVYANLRAGGVKGLMFDYPNTGWAARGGMEDEYATTASAYRTIFRLAHEGLGPDGYIHERNLARGSDVSLGLVASHRVWGDTDLVTPEMLTRCGLRWYKNRVVVHYDMDSKNLDKAARISPDALQALVTMSYVVSGRLLLGNSFGRMTDQHLHALSRVFPYHAEPKSARPLDAFTNACPQVYDFEVNPGWHQVALYNYRDEPAALGVDLAGDTAFGALGLDARKAYYVYDFWNDRLAAKLEGGERLEQELRPLEARMLAVREVLDRPQVLSTNRHVMQGYVDLADVAWDAEGRTLSGKAHVVGGETFKIVLALNGHKPGAATTAGAHAVLRPMPGRDGLAELFLECPDNRLVEWSVAFPAG